jgi:hypothetical protein
MAGSTVIKLQVYQRRKTRQHAEKFIIDWVHTEPELLVQDAKHKLPQPHEKLPKHDSLDYGIFENFMLLFVFIKLFYSSQNIIRVNESRRMRYVRQTTHLKKMRNVNKILIRKTRRGETTWET